MTECVIPDCKHVRPILGAERDRRYEADLVELGVRVAAAFWWEQQRERMIKKWHRRMATSQHTGISGTPAGVRNVPGRTRSRTGKNEKIANAG